MKRVLSLVLALSLVLGSIPAGFAAIPSAGDTLKGYGLLTGDQNGNLNEDKDITRGEMMVVLARLLGKFDEAKAYSIPSTSKDVAGHWAAAYIAFAEKEAWTAGKGNGIFDPNGKVTLQETATFMMKALGYTVTDFSRVVEEANALGLLKDVNINGEPSKAIVRADLFIAALNTINTPVKDSTETLGAKLGVLKVEVSALDPSAAKAISHNIIQVTLSKEATAVKAADFSVVDKDGKALEVKAATLIDSKTVWVDTADQKAGTIYTAKVAGKSFAVTGLQKDASLPEITKDDSRVKDNQTLRIVFSKEMDPRNVLVAANYTFTNGLTATAAEFELDKDGDADRAIVLVTTSAQEANKLYKMTIGAAVTDLYGNKVSTSDDNNLFTFTGIKADTVAPRIKTVNAENGQKVVIEFKEEDSEMSKANAVNPANYVIVDKTDASKTVTVTAAKFKYGLDKNNTVILTTSAQVEKHSYEVTISNVTDKFGNALMGNKSSFTGAPLDVTGPKINGIQALSNTVVKVLFTETVDEATATTAANYVMNNDLAVTKAEIDSADDSIVWLTTSTQKVSTSYKLTVSNVKDEYGNAISSSNVAYFNGMPVDDSEPTVKSAVASVESGTTYVTITFSENVSETTAKVAANYYFGSDIGYGISVKKISDSVYRVKVNALTDGTLYTVVVNNVQDLAGNTVDYDDKNNEKQFVGKVSADTDKPRLVTAYTVDKRTVKLIFDKAMDPTNLVANASYSIKDKDGNAVSFSIKEPDKASSNKEVTLRMTTDVFTNLANGNSTTYTIKVLSGLMGVNGAAVDTSYESKDVYSTTTEPAKVQVSSATSLDKKTVDVKFNQSISLATWDHDSNPATDEIELLNRALIVFDNISDSTKSDVVASLAYVTTGDDQILRVTAASDLVAGDKYEIRFTGVDLTSITDVFGDKDMTGVATADLTATFYASSNTNAAPGLVTYANGSIPGHVTVTMSEEVLKTAAFDASDLVANINNYVVGKDDLSGDITRVEVDGTTVDIFFNNTGLTQGKTYTITMKKGAFIDLAGLGTSEDIDLTFGVSSGTRDAVVIEGVTINKTVAGYTNIYVVFNKSVMGVDAADFTVTVSGSGVAALNANVYNTAGTVRSASKYNTIVVIKTTTAIATGSSVTISLPTTAGVTAKDGATVTAAQSKEVVIPAE